MGGVSAKTARQQKKRRKAGNDHGGGKFKSKKGAGGDVKRRGDKHEPYAYISLDPRMLSKRRKQTAVRRFDSVVRAAKKGVKKRGGRRKRGGPQ